MRYWAYMNGEVPGTFSVEELVELPGFSMTTLVCPASGSASDKNWRRASEFKELSHAFAGAERESKAPSPPDIAKLTANDADVDSLIDNASTKLFSHVADLMKELESSRDERVQFKALQRQLAALKDDLSGARERGDLLEARLARVPELEDALRKITTELEALKTAGSSKDQALAELRAGLEKMRSELEASRRKAQESANDLATRNRLIEKLSKDLSDKEISLAKSLGVIRRLEGSLRSMRPDARPASAEPEEHKQPPHPPKRLPPPPREPERPAPPPPELDDLVDEDPIEPPPQKPPRPHAVEDAPKPPAKLPPAPPRTRPAPKEPAKPQEALLKLLQKIFPEPR